MFEMSGTDPTPDAAAANMAPLESLTTSLEAYSASNSFSPNAAYSSSNASYGTTNSTGMNARLAHLTHLRQRAQALQTTTSSTTAATSSDRITNTSEEFSELRTSTDTHSSRVPYLFAANPTVQVSGVGVSMQQHASMPLASPATVPAAASHSFVPMVSGAPLCQLTVEELLRFHETVPLTAVLNYLSPCPCCQHQVARHARQLQASAFNDSTSLGAPLRSSSNNVAGQVHGATSRVGEGFLKLKKELPVWKESNRKSCFEFLRELTELLSTTEYPTDTWYRVLPLVVEEGYRRTWVHTNIVATASPPSTWEEACETFTSHFESADYLGRLWSKWQSLRFDHGESVQHFADRFMVMLSELDLSAEDKIVKQHFLKCLPSNIRQRYDEFCLNKDLSAGQLGTSSNYEPDDVQTMVNICVKIDVSLRIRSQATTTYSSLSSSSSSTSGSTGSFAKKKTFAGHGSQGKCHLHPESSHSWSECRKNPKNSSAVVKQESRPTPKSYGYGSSSSSSASQPNNKPIAKDTSQIKCYKCEKTGHYANRCPTGQSKYSGPSVASVKVLGVTQANEKVDDHKSNSAEDATLPEAHDHSSENKETLALSSGNRLGTGELWVSVTGEPSSMMKAFVDTGSDISVINTKSAERLQLGTIPTKGRLNLAIADVHAERQASTVPLLLTIYFDPSPKSKSLRTYIKYLPHPVSLELLPFPRCDYEVIIGKDLIPLVFPSGIPLDYLSTPPPGLKTGVSTHVHIAGAIKVVESDTKGDTTDSTEDDYYNWFELERAVEQDGSETVQLTSQGTGKKRLRAPPTLSVSKDKSASTTAPSVPVLASSGNDSNEKPQSSQTQTGPRSVVIELPQVHNFPLAPKDPVTGVNLSETIVDLPPEDLDKFEFQSNEKDSAVFTSSCLEDEYTVPRATLMADQEIVEALEANEKVSGFCTHPDSVLQLRVKSFVDGKVPKTLCRPQYRIPERVTKLVDECIQRWLSEGKIIRAPPGTPYNNPIVVAPKKDAEGNVTYEEIRVCFDFRGLNEWLVETEKDQFQLPYIRDTINKFEGCKIFGEFDLAEAFYQFKLHEKSRPYTAFTFGGVQYMCAGVPFGLSIVPSHFQRAISTIMQGLSFTFPYIDNLPFASKNWSDHKVHALTIIKLMTANNLRIKPSSVKLGHSHMRCLGHFISVDGIGIDPKKLSMIPGWPRPKTGKELMSFLGFVTFIRDHVRHIADLTGPLEAVKNQKTLVWNDQLEQAFTLTKAAVMKAPFLQYPDYTRPFHIATDASNTGVGGVLFQPKVEGEYITPNNIVAICSKKLQDCQTRWSAYKKEFYGILYSLKQFKQYVWGRNDLVVHTDHKPLTFVLQSPSLSSTVHGWFDEMSEFNFKVVHRPGVLNVLPDSLSRMYAATYKDADTWGVTKVFDLSNITLVDPLTSGGKSFPLKDVTGPLMDQEKQPAVKMLTSFTDEDLARLSRPQPTVISEFSCDCEMPPGCCDFNLETSKGITPRGMARYVRLANDLEMKASNQAPSIRVLRGEEAAATVPPQSSSSSSSSDSPVAADLNNTEASSSDFTEVDSQDLDLAIEAEKRGVTIPTTAGERKDLVEKEHAMGHFGIDAIYKSLYSKHIWWPGMRNTILSVVQDCHTCNVFTVGKTGYNPLGYIHASGPWEHVQVDTSVHMPPSPDDHTTLLVIIDVFTGFAILRACKSSTAEEIAKEIWDVFCTFGFPKVLQSDNGHEFVNDLLRALVKICGVEHRFISPYNPRADGKVERAIGTLVSVIKKMVHGSKMFWPIYAPFAQYTFNRKIAALTGSSPFSLMFGRAPNEWRDYTKDPPELIPLDSEEKRSKWKEHQDKMASLLLPAISQRVLKAKNEMVARLNNMRKALIPRSIASGTEVYLVDPIKTNKWQPKYLGPYTVVRRSQGGAYVLRDTTGDILDRHVPIDQLKVLSSKEKKAKQALLEPDQDGEEKQVPTEVSYEVEKIVDHRGDNPSNYEFLVKWKNYASSENTWEPLENFEDREVIDRYWKSLTQPTSTSSSSSSAKTSTNESRSKRRRL
jgi:hypothetical protein